MPKINFTILTILLLAVLISCQSTSNEVAVKKSMKDYTIEELITEVFETIPNVRDITMTNTKNEVYITVESYKKESSAIARIYNEGGQVKKEMASFSGQYKDLEPSLSPNGLKLYFASNRPLHQDSSKTKDMDIWLVERPDLNSEWSEPMNIGAPVNTEGEEFYPSVSSNGNLYFTGEREDSKGKEDIYVSYWKDGSYATPISLSDSINSEGFEFNAFIAPDESYLLFSGYRRPDGFGSADLYISYSDESGAWTKAKNLGEPINSPAIDYCPFVLNNQLYFTSERNNFEAVEEPLKIDNYLNNVTQYSNGLSRIYQVSFKEF